MKIRKGIIQGMNEKIYKVSHLPLGSYESPIVERFSTYAEARKRYFEVISEYQEQNTPYWVDVSQMMMCMTED